MFAPEGFRIMIASLIIGSVGVYIATMFGGIPQIALYVLSFAVVAFTFWFFRDPKRTPPVELDRVLLAPADGKILLIEEVDEPIYRGAPSRQISIFLSPLNVHVNRIPASGQIDFDRYIPGEYLVAWHPKSSELNERSEIGVTTPAGEKVLFKQIAGAVARRIVYHVHKGDQVTAGDRFGIVKFGSRMDILFPLSANVVAEVGDRVVGGETILAHLSGEAEDDA